MRVLLISSAFCCFIAVVSAIICYECQSYEQPNCNLYFDPEGIKEVDCDEVEMPEYLKKYERRLPAVGCITNFYEGVENQRYFIRRGCLFGKGKALLEEACNRRDPYVPFRIPLDCTPCYDDLCNTTGNTGSTLGSISVLSIMIVSGVFLFFV